MDPVMTLERGRPYTAADLDTMPDYGHQYEIMPVAPALGVEVPTRQQRLTTCCSGSR